ncbi:hypothetical protein MATL_G00107020 [Megalops atlanticus]|uniref:Uncharacterized protein n=1 Tax=Megalops atlanticus TaxID=7932 RepID=A0A9D3T6E1_MEGAT|nr:hypothetical protein MATL_G00107020 [Megalops atlanticus]
MVRCWTVGASLHGGYLFSVTSFGELWNSSDCSFKHSSSRICQRMATLNHPQGSVMAEAPRASLVGGDGSEG